MSDQQTDRTSHNIGGYDECEELTCTDRAEWLFSATCVEPTPLCEEHALEFPNDQLRPIFHGDSQ